MPWSFKPTHRSAAFTRQKRPELHGPLPDKSGAPVVVLTLPPGAQAVPRLMAALAEGRAVISSTAAVHFVPPPEWWDFEPPYRSRPSLLSVGAPAENCLIDDG